MKRTAIVSLFALGLVSRSEVSSDPVSNAATAADLAGTWAGTLSHDGETRPFALGLKPDSTGKIMVLLSAPATHLEAVPIGRVGLVVEGDSVRLGPFRFAYDRAQRTLSGTMPASLAPVYEIPMLLHKVDHYEMPSRPALTAPEVKPVWTYAADSPSWAGPTFADGIVYVGTQDGWLYALDARTGAKKWRFHAGGPIRTRPTVQRNDVYVQADDGFLYRVEAKSGAMRWHVRIVEKPIERLPFDNPKSRYDRFGSDVTAAGDRLYVGTHDGKVLALDPADGKRLWEFQAGDAVLAAPAVRDGRVFFGSYDRWVYALDAATGAQIWKRDTQGAVVSTPALDGDRLVIGNRCYDLLGLDARSGEIAWKRYIWGSWVESSATIRDGIAYVGSSDADAVFAFDASTGKRRWATDVFGWAWGQPVTTVKRVFMGTSGQVGYPAKHDCALLAFDRATGTVLWRYPAPTPESGAYGFPGTPALGAGKVYATSLDGHVYAFTQ